jgi:hypothetical protein
MASPTGINTPQMTAAQWSAVQIAQRKAQIFLSAATGAAAKSNLADFQRAFNYALEGIKIGVAAGGGDPAAVARLLGSTPILEDGLWGPQAAIAMAIIIWTSFPPNVWSQASLELATSGVINHTPNALPIPRNKIASIWYPKWKVQVAEMVWKDYATPVIQNQNPPVTQNNANTTVIDSQSNQPNANNQIDQAQGQNVPKTSTQQAIDVEVGEPINIVATAPKEKSYTWLWVALGLTSVGAGLWWMFGRKAR